MKSRLILATNNKGKLREFESMIAAERLDFQVLSFADFPDIPHVIEDGESFENNAEKKALTIAGFTGELAVADDSGLEVDYLDGAPGIYSARFSGEPQSDEANNRKLLDLLKDVPWEERTARFRCVIAIVTPDMKSFFVEGVCEGYIAEGAEGDGGFGYDPIFYLPEYKKTMAQLPLEEKNRISHRARAFTEAMEILRNI